MVSNRFLRVSVVGLAILSIGGCSLFRDAGSPKAPFNEDDDLNTLLKNYNAAASLDSFFTPPADSNGLTPEQRRNKFIAARLVLMNIRYIQFVKGVTADRQLLDSATDILALSLNLAGASVSSAATKTALAAIAAGLTGSRAILEKDFFYDKTVPALVAEMNVDRKKALVPLLQGMGQTIDQYSIAAALNDLNDYYNAGTFNGAIAVIQSDAGTADAMVSSQISDLSKMPQSVFDFKKKVLAWIIAHTNDETQLTNVKRALGLLGDTADQSTTVQQATTELHKWIQINVVNDDQVKKAQTALTASGIQL